MRIDDIFMNSELSKLLEESINKTYYKFIGRNTYLKEFIDKEDFTQECYIFLMTHIEKFDSERSSIRTFIPMVIMSSAKNQIRLIKGERQQFNNSTISLDIKNENEDSQSTLLDFVSDEKNNLEIDSINNIHLKEILKTGFLSELESNILKLMINGYKQQEIATLLKISQSYVTKKYKKIKEKMVVNF